MGVASTVIHFAIAGEHFQEYWLFGVFMLGAAWLCSRDQMHTGTAKRLVTGTSTGAPPGTRTPNPRIKSPLLCQLS
jgi:hypothetical protein